MFYLSRLLYWTCVIRTVMWRSYCPTHFNQCFLYKNQHYKQIITAHITDNCLDFQVHYSKKHSRDARMSRDKPAVPGEWFFSSARTKEHVPEYAHVLAGTWQQRLVTCPDHLTSHLVDKATLLESPRAGSIDTKIFALSRDSSSWQVKCQFLFRSCDCFVWWQGKKALLPWLLQWTSLT